MDAGGGGGGLENGGNHALANGGGGHAPANQALANGGGHALANGEGGHGLANGGGGHAPANQALANGGGHALANGGGQAAAMEAGGAIMVAPNEVVPAQALYMAFLRLPAQEIARCRRVCRLWRDITNTELFRRAHHHHPYRTEMPLVFFWNPGVEHVSLRAVDMRERDRVSRPVMRCPLHHEAWQIHGSCAGVLLLSSGNRLYACNPCTHHWASLPPLHVDNHIIGFYMTGFYGLAGFGFQVLYHDRREPDCEYWIFELGALAPPPTPIGRPGPVELDLVLANGIAPSYAIPPVFYVDVYLCWLPQAARDNTAVLMFDTEDRSFRLLPPPTIQVDGEDIPVGVGSQLFEIGHRLAMTFISPARVDVWVRNNLTELWSCRYHIPLQVDAPLQVDVIDLNGGYHQNAGVFAVAQDRSGLLRVRRPHILLADQQTFLSGHAIQESFLLHPFILPLDDEDAVDGDPPFFQNQ